LLWNEWKKRGYFDSVTLINSSVDEKGFWREQLEEQEVLAIVILDYSRILRV
jgi:hypothetical protein